MSRGTACRAPTSFPAIDKGVTALAKLTQQDIWLAYPALERLLKVSLPAELSLRVASLAAQLRAPYLAVEQERQTLVRRYGKLDKSAGLITVEMDSDEAGDYTLAFAGMLCRVWTEEIPFQKVKIPRLILETCRSCGHITETLFRIEPQLLLPLAEHFIEMDGETLLCGALPGE